MSTAAVIIVDPTSKYTPEGYSPHMEYVLVYTGNTKIPGLEDELPLSPAESGEWLAIFRNTKPINNVLFRSRVNDVLTNGSNIVPVAVDDEFWAEKVWELPTLDAWKYKED